MKQTRPLGLIILAAGASSRMGRPKLLLPWGNETILSHLIKTYSDLGAEQISVVLGFARSELERELDRLDNEVFRIVNPRPENGMFSSIQVAARWDGWKQGLTHFLISLGDQPQITSATLNGLLNFALQKDLVAQPSFEGRRRHPVILPASHFQELAESPCPDLKAFLALRSIRLWETKDSDLNVDLDTPEDYQQAALRFS